MVDFSLLFGSTRALISEGSYLGQLPTFPRWGLHVGSRNLPSDFAERRQRLDGNF